MAHHEGVSGVWFLVLTARMMEELFLTHSGENFRRWYEGSWLDFLFQDVGDNEATGDKVDLLCCVLI